MRGHYKFYHWSITVYTGLSLVNFIWRHNLSQPFLLASFFGCRVILIFFLGWWLVPSPKIVINLPWAYEKLPCKGESYRFSGNWDPLEQTDRQTSCYFIIRIAKIDYISSESQLPPLDKDILAWVTPTKVNFFESKKNLFFHQTFAFS